MQLTRHSLARALAVAALLVAVAAPRPSFAQPGLLAQIVDVTEGDTITVQLAGDWREQVRLIGINAPERASPDWLRGCYGEEAWLYTYRLTRGERVMLELDAEARDSDGRLLAYAWLRGLNLNIHLAAEGYVREAAVPPNLRYQELIHDAVTAARAEDRGLWTACEQVLAPLDAESTTDGDPPAPVTIDRPRSDPAQPSPSDAPAALPTPAPRPSPVPGSAPPDEHPPR